MFRYWFECLFLRTVLPGPQAPHLLRLGALRAKLANHAHCVCAKERKIYRERGAERRHFRVCEEAPGFRPLDGLREHTRRTV